MLEALLNLDSLLYSSYFLKLSAVDLEASLYVVLAFVVKSISPATVHSSIYLVIIGNFQIEIEI